MKNPIIGFKRQVRWHAISIGCFHQALFRDDRATTNLIITNSRRLAEMMIELEELIPGAHSPLNRVRNVATESVSDALISNRPKWSRNRTPDKEALPGGVVVVHSQPDSLAAVVQVINCGVEDIVVKCMTPSAQYINTPSLPGYIPLNTMISRAISYELKLYADFVFNSEEEQR
ncbi:hypothetical protein Cgig2_002553 [Carnegiea gigantea]|uniref:Uncharacterized protein n=1 Tax=Carnegiea gigantea TaxID=171969 RepID=A0A9Q1JH76_9CARY|nr:hypothetical protein Cgig2_002553 [Carnegiea gigantea]